MMRELHRCRSSVGYWSPGMQATLYGFKARFDLQYASVQILEWRAGRLRVRVTATGEVISAEERRLFDPSWSRLRVELEAEKDTIWAKESAVQAAAQVT